MKTITFDDIDAATERQIDYIKNYCCDKNTNGLYNLLYAGYSMHVPIVIRPDDILNNVAAIWAKYVDINAEKFRERFVEHDGKKRLTYMSGGSYSDERMQEFMDGLMQLIVDDQKDDKVLWAASSNFTTTNETDTFVRATATLASQKAYYDYSVMLCCGLKSVTLEGSEQDWEELVFALQKMPTLNDDMLLAWKQRLVGIVNQIIDDESPEFWQTVVTREQGGSGPQTIEGWITVFNPMNEAGDWVDTVLDKGDILDLTTDFDLDVNDNGNAFKLNISAGPSSNVFENGEFRVLNTQNIEEID